MPVAIKITIQSVEDAKAGKAIVPGLDMAKTEECQMEIGILEKGTVNGQTTLMFICTGEDGLTKCGQMTANQFEMLIATFRGAVQRFGK